jgi:peptidoglycan/LPS O-acetylase OafA/YrhL
MDALRALASLSIVVVHAAFLSGLFFGRTSVRGLVAHLDFGVTLFFLLSGYLLYRPFLAARILGAPRTRVRDYARRRFLRIAPAYWLALTVLAIVPGIYGVFSSNWWVYYGLLQNWPLYTKTGGCAVDQFRCGISPTWTLSIEVLFYAALPFYAIAMANLARRLRRVPWLALEGAALVTLAVYSVLIQGLKVHYSPYLFFSPLGRGWWFALGMGLAALSVWAEQRGRTPEPLRTMASHPGLLYVVAAALYVVPARAILPPSPLGAFPAGSMSDYVGEYVLFGVIALLLVLPAVFGTDITVGWPRRLLSHPVLSWLGLISYGVFLWHYPIILGLRDLGVPGWIPSAEFPVLLVATLALTIPCAALSYYLVERPIMRRKRALPAAVPTRPAGLAAG